eukprot:PITA_21305
MYDTSIIHHTIPIIYEEKPMQQKLRKIHPNLEGQIKVELNKLLKAKIIFPVRHSKWISNLVLVRKKNGDIRICINFRNLIKASQKDNLPLPTMEQTLHSVAGSELMSFLDGFSGYKQILVHPDDRLKTTFRTNWGTYAYQKMLFGLINVGATFQRAMDITFKDLINRSVVVYLDDITVFSKKRANHLHDLKQIFERCKSSNLQGAELNYSEVEKQAFTVFKSIKHFRPFLLKTHTKVIVQFSTVRQLLVQREVGEKRANWVTTLQEYDLDIKQAKIVRGQGFFRLLEGASNISEHEDSDNALQINEISIMNYESQYADLVFYLKNGYSPPNLSYKNKLALRLKTKHFEIIDDVLFRRNYDLVLLICLEKTEAQKVLQELHDGPAGGHFGGDTTAHKIIHAGYYWPTLFKDSHDYVRKCKIFQSASGRQRKPAFPLQPINIEQPFEQWELDIIGEIVPHSSKQHIYILTAMDYFTKWVEVIPLKVANSDEIIEFIITKFGVPNALIFDNASYFSRNTILEFSLKRGFKLKYFANYYPQGNGLAESTNKNLIKIIKRIVDQNQKNWHKYLIFALWADHIT